MATFTSYKATIDVPDRYAEGYALNAKEAAALNGLRAELISHRIRASVFGDLNKGDEASPELVQQAQTKANELAETFEFGMLRQGNGVQRQPKDPLTTMARRIARSNVLEKMRESGKFPNGLSKKGEPVGEGQYDYERYLDRVDYYSKSDEVIKAAKKALAAGKTGTEVEL